MSVLKLIFTLSTLSVFVLENPAFAQNKRPPGPNNRKPEAPKSAGATDGKRPAYNQFCEEGAQDLMQSLDKKNKDRFEQIAGYKKQLDDLKKYNAMLVEAGVIKKRYLESVSALATPSKNSEVTSKLDDTKSALRNGLTLSAISLLIKKQDESKEEIPTELNMAGLCKSNESHVLCQKPSPQNVLSDTVSKVTRWIGVAEGHKLDQTLKNFQSISSMPETQQKNLRQEIKKIIDDIPKDVAPEAILELIKTSSPTNDVSRDNLFKCLEEKNTDASRKACSTILTNNENREGLIKAVSSESNALTSKLRPVSSLVDQALEQNKSEIVKALKGYDASSKASTQNLKDVITDARKLVRTATKVMSQKTPEEELQLRLNLTKKREVGSIDDDLTIAEKMAEVEKNLKDSEAIFYKRPKVDINNANALILQQKAIELAKENSEYFDSHCDFSNKHENTDFIKLEKCAAIVKGATDNIDTFNKDHLEKLKTLTAKIDTLTKEKDFVVNENLKEYIALKFICNCQKDKSNVKSSYENSLDLSTPTCSGQFITISKIDGLSDKAGIIAQTLYANEIVPLDDVKSCSFSSEKLKTFTDSCNSISSKDQETNKICQNIKNEYDVKLQKNTEADKAVKKWDAIHEKNHVVYNPRTGGYTAVPKKSALRIFGEGVLPVAPMLLPMWLNNWQTKNYISSMTTEALNQKQYLHNIDVYNKSPWMYDFNYFLYNPFNFSNSNGALGAGTNTTGFSF